MDKQTAIDLLDNLLGMVEDNHDSDYDTAIKMGIDALKSNTFNALSALDCVERQAAKDAMRNLKKWYVVSETHKNIGFLYDDVMFTLDKLPSVQTEIIRCEECKFYDHFWNGDWCSLKNIDVKDANDFCGRAKRRTDE